MLLKSLITYSVVEFGCQICIFLNAENLICQSTDISKCFKGPFNFVIESRLYINLYHVLCLSRAVQLNQSNRKKEALHMTVQCINIQYIEYCILILSYVKLLFYDLIDKISNFCG